MRTLLACCGAAIVATAAAQSAPLPYDFKGIKLNTPITEFGSHPRFECVLSKTPIADVICELRKSARAETIARVPVTRLALYFYDGRLSAISIRVKGDQLQPVVDALAERYGSPDARPRQLETGAGGVIEIARFHWTNGVSSITASANADQRLDASIDFRMLDYLRKFDLRANPPPSRPSDDL